MIELTLTPDMFTNGMFEQVNDAGCLVRFNLLDECWKFNNVEYSVNALNIEMVQEDDTSRVTASIPAIIGMGNDYVRIDTLYEELKGNRVNADNLEKCTFYLYDKLLKE